MRHLHLVLGLTILSWSAFSPAGYAANVGATECPPSVIAQYPGTGPAPFAHADGIDEQDGFLYVVDHPKRILKMTLQGQYVTAWGGQGLPPGSGFLQATDVAAAPNGTIFVVDWNANEVQKFLSNGTYVKKWGGAGTAHGKFSQPYGISVDGAGNVYVSDTANGRVEKFDNNGNYLMTFGSPGTGLGQISGSFGIDVDDAGYLYVAECGTNTHRIQKFSPEGTPIRMWGSRCETPYEGECIGRFNCPSDVVADSEGRVYVVDTWNYRVQIFDSTGVFLARLGEEGSGPDQFDVPWRLCRDGSQSVYTTERDNNRIMKLAPGAPGCGSQIALHARPATGGNACSAVDLPVTCADLETALPAGAGGPAPYFAYLIATPFETLAEGITGLQAGIQYENQELSIFNWQTCGASQLTTSDWPSSGSGITLLWPDTGCQDGGELRIAGYFYVGAYGAGSLKVIPHRSTGEVRMADCAGAERTIALEKCGWVSFGGGTVGGKSGGCNPCLEPCSHGSTSGVGSHGGALVFSVGPFFPNPLRGGSGRLAFVLSIASRVQASVFDITGRRVATLLEGNFAAGNHTAPWDGMTDTGAPAPNGVYFVKVTAGKTADSSKILIIRD